MGSAVGTFVSYLVMIILNLIALHRMLPEIPSVVRMGIRPLLASVIMGAVSYPVYLLLTRFMSEKFAVIPVILLAILVYLVAAVFTKAITREEIVQLPKGEKLADKQMCIRDSLCTHYRGHYGAGAVRKREGFKADCAFLHLEDVYKRQEEYLAAHGEA